jgi:hypothetical protein
MGGAFELANFRMARKPGVERNDIVRFGDMPTIRPDVFQSLWAFLGTFPADGLITGRFSICGRPPTVKSASSECPGN